MAPPAMHAQEMRVANHVFIAAHYDRSRLFIDPIGVPGFLSFSFATADLLVERTPAVCS